jgi:HAD superfamily hydrolase (TIGR01509 family)
MQMAGSKMRGIIFDFNGTMLFDAALQEKAWRLFLDEKIGREPTDAEFQMYVHGRNADVSVPYFMNKTLTRGEIDALSEEKEQIYRQLCLEQPEAFHLAEGLTDFLDLLAANGWPVTIATATAWNNVKFYFKHLALDRWFDINKVAYNDGTVKGKPEPDLYLRAARNIGILPEHCMVFEDAVAGLEAAKRAGSGRIVGVASMLDAKQLYVIGGVYSVIPDYRTAAALLE